LAKDDKRRQRRSSEEVRALLLGAARQLFTERGFAGTGTREIAAVAGVSESLLFTHFGTKAALFEAAVVAPLVEFFETYVGEWERHEIGEISTWDLCERFLAGFYDLLREHHDLVMALVTARRFNAEVASSGEPATRMFAESLQRMDRRVVDEMPVRGFRELDVPLTVRLAVGMVMSVALLEEWLFSGDLEQVARDRLVREMTMFLIYGIASDTCCNRRADVAAPPKRRVKAARRR
jgi:AcrR family transcriptional regulator